jgi:hypothetical protein
MQGAASTHTQLTTACNFATSLCGTKVLQCTPESGETAVVGGNALLNPANKQHQGTNQPNPQPLAISVRSSASQRVPPHPTPPAGVRLSAGQVQVLHWSVMQRGPRRACWAGPWDVHQRARPQGVDRQRSVADTISLEHCPTVQGHAPSAALGEPRLE